MRKFLAAAALVSAVSLTTFAVGQVPKPMPATVATPMTQPAAPANSAAALDARSLASDQAVGDARRYYRAQCVQYQSPGYCDCVTAGVAQALMPTEVRIAARTIGERINAEGDAREIFDESVLAQSSAERIDRVEAHYDNACAQFRR